MLSTQHTNTQIHRYKSVKKRKKVKIAPPQCLVRVFRAAGSLRLEIGVIGAKRTESPRPRQRERATRARALYASLRYYKLYHQRPERGTAGVLFLISNSPSPRLFRRAPYSFSAPLSFPHDLSGVCCSLWHMIFQPRVTCHCCCAAAMFL